MLSERGPFGRLIVVAAQARRYCNQSSPRASLGARIHGRPGLPHHSISVLAAPSVRVATASSFSPSKMKTVPARVLTRPSSIFSFPSSAPSSSITKSLSSSTMLSLEEEVVYRIKASVAFAAGAGRNDLITAEASFV